MKTMLFILASASVIMVAGMFAWLGYQLWIADKLLRRVHRLLRPEIERDGQGRPLRERL